MLQVSAWPCLALCRQCDEHSAALSEAEWMALACSAGYAAQHEAVTVRKLVAT